MLRPADIRHSSNRQLARLLRCGEADASRLSSGKKSLTPSMLSYAAVIGIPIPILLAGIRLRQKDVKNQIRHQAKVEAFLATVGMER